MRLGVLTNHFPHRQHGDGGTIKSILNTCDRNRVLPEAREIDLPIQPDLLQSRRDVLSPQLLAVLAIFRHAKFCAFRRRVISFCTVRRPVHKVRWGRNRTPAELICHAARERISTGSLFTARRVKDVRYRTMPDITVRNSLTWAYPQEAYNS